MKKILLAWRTGSIAFSRIPVYIRNKFLVKTNGSPCCEAMFWGYQNNEQFSSKKIMRMKISVVQLFCIYQWTTIIKSA